MKTYKYAFLGIVFSLSLLCTPAFAQSNTPEDPEREPGVKFLDSSEAFWFRRSVNDSIYHAYTVNGVFNERDKVRLGQEFKIYRPTPVKFEKLNPAPQGPTPEYTIKMNGKLVQVKD